MTWLPVHERKTPLFWMVCDTWLKMVATDPLHGLTLNMRECWLEGVIKMKSLDSRRGGRNNWLVGLDESIGRTHISCLQWANMEASIPRLPHYYWSHSWTEWCCVLTALYRSSSRANLSAECFGHKDRYGKMMSEMRPQTQTLWKTHWNSDTHQRHASPLNPRPCCILRLLTLPASSQHCCSSVPLSLPWLNQHF